MTWATSVPILVFLGLSVLDLGPMSDSIIAPSQIFMQPPIRGGGINISRVQFPKVLLSNTFRDLSLTYRDIRIISNLSLTYRDIRIISKQNHK